MSKPKVAFFDFTCCEGCQLQMANLGDTLLDILGLVDVVEFREVMSEKSDVYDIAIVEGSITTEHQVKRIKEIRETASVVIAYGSCAAIGGINGMKNNFDLEDIKKYVYKDDAKHFNTIPTMPLHQVIKVDYKILNCPVYPPEVIAVLKAALAGLPYTVADNAVCVECKLNENECMFDKGITCMGPVTKGGCNSWCINNNNICYGCRGMVTNPAENGQMDILKKHDISLDWVLGKINMYNKPLELEKEGSE
jgi:sulfhydrogenase subunit delta